MFEEAKKKRSRQVLRQTILEHSPWLPPSWELADAGALQALNAGEATPEQQKRALRFIIEQLSASYQMSFYPGGEEGRRNSDFAEGRRFVGNEIVKFLKLNLSKLRREP